MTDDGEQDGGEQPDGQAQNFQFMVPPELEGGSYANMLSTWHTPYEFTLDFSATQPPHTVPDTGELIVPCRVVSRVKIPVTLVFDVIRRLNQQMTAYEADFGIIKRPGEEAE